MCKGYAILINDKRIYGLGNSHSDLARQKGIQEDDYLKVNVVYDDTQERGYRFEPDSHDKSQTEDYIQQAHLTKKGDIPAQYLNKLKEYCLKHEADIFRTLCKNLQSATIEGNQFNDSATIEGNQSNSSATIKGDIIIKDMVIGNKETKISQLILEFGKGKSVIDCTLTAFVEWLQNKSKD